MSDDRKLKEIRLFSVISFPALEKHFVKEKIKWGLFQTNQIILNLLQDLNNTVFHSKPIVLKIRV